VKWKYSPITSSSLARARFSSLAVVEMENSSEHLVQEFLRDDRLDFQFAPIGKSNEPVERGVS
jgi:hypothetical protein